MLRKFKSRMLTFLTGKRPLHHEEKIISKLDQLVKLVDSELTQGTNIANKNIFRVDRIPASTTCEVTLYFVDSALRETDTEFIDESQSSSALVDVHYFDANQNPLRQLVKLLESKSGIGEIHIVSLGDEPPFDPLLVGILLDEQPCPTHSNAPPHRPKATRDLTATRAKMDRFH